MLTYLAKYRYDTPDILYATYLPLLFDNDDKAIVKDKVSQDGVRPARQNPRNTPSHQKYNRNLKSSARNIQIKGRQIALTLKIN